MTSHEDALRANRAWWEEAVDIHVASEAYDVDGFKAGRRDLNRIELEELRDVAGRTLLHLQCHFGLDTLAWARRGAVVTGVDWAHTAIEQARSLADELAIPARFIRSDIDDLPATLDETFDIVFTSYGVINWMPDLARWGEVVARHTRPGGTFYMVEFHPVAWMFDEHATEGWRLRYPYRSATPIRDDSGRSYADPDTPMRTIVNYSWAHGIADVLDALIGNGFDIEFVHEFDGSVYRQFPFLLRGDDGLWRAPAHLPTVPLLFSVRAAKR